MAYTIKYTNGKILATIADQSFDNISTSLTIVGKNSSAYGESVNTNFVHLLENFANSSEPRSPLTGQLWYNTVAGRMYVYTTSSFKPVGGPIVSPTRPANLVAGDLWLDTTGNELKWYNGSELISSGKNYSDVTGKAGWVNETVKDVALADRTITSLYNNGVLLGVLSEQDIMLNNPYCGTATIRAGLTLNSTLGNIRFVGTATHAETIIDPETGLNLSPDDLFRKNATNTTNAPINIRVNTTSGVTDSALSIGADSNLQFLIDADSEDPIPPAVIYNNYPDTKLDVRVQNSNDGAVTMITLDGFSQRIGIKNRNPSYDLDVVGDVRISGDLTVIGSSTYITSVDLRVNDKNIQLAYPPGSLDDTQISGGGIILHGTSNHSWIYNNNINNSGKRGWETEDCINLINAENTFKIAGNDVISKDSLGTVITSAPGLVNLPTLPQLNFSGMTLSGNTVTTNVFPLTDLVLNPSGNVDVANNRIINVATPVVDADAVTKKYVDDEIALNAGGLQSRKPYTISMDVTNFLNVNQDIKNYLDKLLPVNGGAAGPLYRQPDGAACTVLAVSYSASTSTFILDLNKSTVMVDKDGSTSSQIVLRDVAGSVAVVTPMPIPSYQVKLYQVSTGTWTFIQDVS